MRSALCCLLLLATPLAAQRPVADLVAEFNRLAARPLWPGFTPALTPIAIYDGQRTWLIRHPAPPTEFAPSTVLPGAFTMPGQQADVRANTHTMLAGVPTATLLWPDHPVSLTRLAAVLIHESFHVFQSRAHPGWFGNEGTLFTYPVTDSIAQLLQRLETEAFRRALLPPGPSACWTSRATALRAMRARQVGADAMAYERGNDLNEGLAKYVEWRASDAPPDSLIPAAGFPPDGVRLRAYAVGPAQAVLLDHFRPDWITTLEQDTTLTLDAMLAQAVAPISCRADFTAHETDSIASLAGHEAAGILSARAELRRNFVARPGWQLVIELPVGTPLWPEQFDPLNLTPLANGEVLHQRHLRLSGDHGHLEVLDQWALTVPAGAHPLFNGIRKVVIAGLATRPDITARGDSMTVRAPGIDATLTGMVVTETGQQVTVRTR